MEIILQILTETELLNVVHEGEKNRSTDLCFLSTQETLFHIVIKRLKLLLHIPTHANM